MLSHGTASGPSSRSVRAFTLIEVLAALLLMAIVIPVAMQATGIASRAGMMGQRKAAAMRIADRMLNELVVTGEAAQATSTSGTVSEGDGTYAWTLQSTTWSEDALTQLTVSVSFSVQGHSHTVSVSTLIDPGATPATEEAAP